MSLFLDTPLSKAVFELLSSLNKSLEKVLENKTGAVKAYIFGGCAVHIYTNARGSNDLDVQLEAAEKLDVHSFVLDSNSIYFYDSDGIREELHLDDTFQVGITPVVSPDYKERAIPIDVGSQALHVYLVSALDVSISKLSRCADDDIKDIISMYKMKRFNFREFQEAANEALLYTATPNSLRSNIEHVKMKLMGLKYSQDQFSPE